MLFCLLAWAMLLLSGCSDPDDPETQIRELIRTAEGVAESRDLHGVKPLISAQYQDEQGRDRRQLIAIAAANFLRNQSIHLLVHTEEITITGKDSATAVLYVAMATQPFEAGDSLTGFRQNLQRFDLSLSREDGEWRVASSQWRAARREDFLR